MLRTVLTLGQLTGVKGERTKEDATENLSKRCVTRPVSSVNLT